MVLKYDTYFSGLIQPNFHTINNTKIKNGTNMYTYIHIFTLETLDWENQQTCELHYSSIQQHSLLVNATLIYNHNNLGLIFQS